MKILFISINVTNTTVQEELGISYIAAFLRMHRYECEVYCFVGDAIDYNQIILFGADIIGFPMYHRTAKKVLEVIDKIKKEVPSTYILLGGYTPTYYYEELMSTNANIDFVIRGEGELPTLELVNELTKDIPLLNNVSSLIYKENGLLVVNPEREHIEDLDELPFPDRSILQRYNLRTANISSSRGCLRNCSFCVSHNYWKSRNGITWRGRSAKNFVDEICYLINTYKISRFSVVDASYEDSYTENFQRLQEFCDEIKMRNINITYFINFRSEIIKHIPVALVNSLIETGLTGVFLGVEAFNNHDLKVLGKSATADDNVQAIKFFKQYPIQLDVGIINFNPYSTFDSLKENAKYISLFKYASYFTLNNQVRIYKGSNLYNRVYKDGLLKSDVDLFDECNYYYENSAICDLVDSINKYFTNINQKYDFSEFIRFFATDFLNLLIHYKKHFINQKEKEYELTVNVEKEVIEILTEMNRINTEWFMSLLDEARNRGSKNIYQEILTENLSDAFIKQIIQNLTSIKNNYTRQLLKLDRSNAIII